MKIPKISFEGLLGLTVALIALVYAAATFIWADQRWISWLVLMISSLSLIVISYYGLGSKVGYTKALIGAIMLTVLLFFICVYRVVEYKPPTIILPPNADQIAQATLDKTIPPIFAHLQTELVVDSLVSNDQRFHFRVRNIGNFSVKLVDVSFSSTAGTYTAELSGLITRNLAPQQPVIINALPDSKFSNNIIALQIHYQSTFEGKSYDFTSKSQFDLSQGETVGQDFDPISTEETIGDNRTIATRQDIYNHFTDDTGGMTFIIPSYNLDKTDNKLFLGSGLID